MAFKTAQSMPKSQQQVSCQGSTTWFYRKATLRRKIPGSLYRQSSTFESSLTPITKTIQKGWQQPLSPLIRLYQWQGLWRLQQRNMVDLLSLPPSPSKQKSLRPLSCLVLSDFLPSSPVWVRRFFIKSIVWFSSLVSYKVRRFFIKHT